MITPTHDRAQAMIEVKPHISYEAATSAVEKIDRLLDEKRTCSDSASIASRYAKSAAPTLTSWISSDSRRCVG